MTDRERFENWARNERPTGSKLSLARDSFGVYTHFDTHTAWAAWQAASEKPTAFSLCIHEGPWAGNTTPGITG
jgi:hypothetical protein